MTKLLEQAFAEISKLPPEDQDALAAMILEALEDEHRWDELFAASQPTLDSLAANAQADIDAGRFKKMGFDEL
jgi:hypothetical protein